MRTVWTIFLGWVLAAGMAACGGNNGVEEGETRPVSGLKKATVKLAGYYYLAELQPFSGSISSYGESADQAIKLAIKEINDAGGIKGQKLGLLACDSKTDPQTSADCMRELVTLSPLSAVIGDVASSCTIPAGEVAAEHKMVLVSNASTSPAITHLDDDGYVFRTVPSGALQAQVASAIAVREGYEKVFVAHRNDSFGIGFKDVFLENFVSGARQATALAYDEGTVDYDQQVLAAAKAYNPDAVYLISFVDDGAAVLKAAATDNWTAPGWLLADGIVSDEFIGMVGNNAYIEGAIGTKPSDPSGPEYATYDSNFRKTYNKGPHAFSAHAYDAVYLLAMAMELSSNADDRTQIRDRLADVYRGENFGPNGWAKFLSKVRAGATSADYDGASGPVDFDEHGDVVSNTAEWQIKSGQIVDVGCWTPEGEPCE